MKTSRLIHLTQGKSAVVDAADYERLSRWQWFAHFDKKINKWYAMRSQRIDGNLSYVYMHREIMGAAASEEVDHANGDGLDNRRSVNLRIATHRQNLANRGPQRNNTSGYKGVTWNKQLRRWCAQIHIAGKHLHLGVFDIAEDGARAYDTAAREHFGEFAYQNLTA
jgi:hypothetical protein